MEHICRWGRASSWSQRQHSSQQGTSSWNGSKFCLCPWVRLLPLVGGNVQRREVSLHTPSGQGQLLLFRDLFSQRPNGNRAQQTEPQTRLWIAAISHLSSKQGILMLCRITVWGTLPSISLILCKFTSNSYCQNTVWHLHSTCFFSGKHKAASVQKEYVASPWVTHCECWRLWNIFWNGASHKHFIFQKQSHYFCHFPWQCMYADLGAST